MVVVGAVTLRRRWCMMDEGWVGGRNAAMLVFMMSASNKLINYGSWKLR
jgi:hypothetical protein